MGAPVPLAAAAAAFTTSAITYLVRRRTVQGKPSSSGGDGGCGGREFHEPWNLCLLILSNGLFVHHIPGGLTTQQLAPFAAPSRALASAPSACCCRRTNCGSAPRDSFGNRGSHKSRKRFPKKGWKIGNELRCD